MDLQSLKSIIIILALTPLFLSFVICFSFLRIKKLKDTIKQLKSELNKQNQKQQEFVKFYVGAKVLISDCSLSHTDSAGKKTSFSVDYECEVIDVSETEIKITALNFIGNDTFSRDPQNKSGIIAFMQNRWVSKKEAQLIMDESHKRQVKLDKLGI
jgi:hypothetical protein